MKAEGALVKMKISKQSCGNYALCDVPLVGCADFLLSAYAKSKAGCSKNFLIIKFRITVSDVHNSTKFLIQSYSQM
jgi:hypothetical protein